MNNLQTVRIARGLTQADVSALLKPVDPRMDVGMVSRFERGACLPTAPVLLALESALRASREELYPPEELTQIMDELPQLTPELTRLISLIPIGRERAISRYRLRQAYGMSDRKTREAVAQARLCGCCILNRSDGQGYYRSDDPGEIRRYRAQELSRAKNILRAVRAMET